MKKKPVEITRTLTLVRIEASYGPIYVVVCLDENATETAKEKHSPEERANFYVETGCYRPHAVLQNAVAMFKGGLLHPPHMFTAIKSVVVPTDFDLEHKTASDWFELFPEADD